MKPSERIIIVGGGLSGLTLAYLLSKQHIEATILEASSRVGGRIHTVKGALDTPLELGATWISEMHLNLIAFLDELGLPKYPQFSKGKSLFQTQPFEPIQEFSVPEADNSSYRIAGGTQALTDALAQKLIPDNIKLNKQVTSIRETDGGVILETAKGEKFNADKVVLCLPPQLAGSQIDFIPELPASIAGLLPGVQTWMAGSIKFVLEYSEPFWRQKGYSGMLYSHAGVIAEMYDHTNLEETKFGFTGFLHGGLSTYSQERRKEFVLRQLGALLGKEALQPTAYFDKVWDDEFIVGGNPIIQRPHQNNGHAVLQESYLNGKLYFSGTESSRAFAGYMEGAILSAKYVYDNILT